MKMIYILIACIALIGVVIGFSQKYQSNGGRQKGLIKPETSKIVYVHHTNSGIAIQTRIEISRGLLVWNRHNFREGTDEGDKITCDQKDYDQLVNTLTEIQFSAKDMDDTSSGGSGYGYSFQTADGEYLHFNSTYKFSGNYDQLHNAIQLFIKQHGKIDE